MVHSPNTKLKPSDTRFMITLGKRSARFVRYLRSKVSICETFTTEAFASFESDLAIRKNENYLLMIAHFGTASHVERLVRNYRSVKRHEALEKAQEQHVQRELSWYLDDEGYWVIRGRLPPETGSLVQQVLEQAMEEQFQELRDVPAGTSPTCSS